MSDLEAFRADVRAWLEANCPPEMREPVRDEDDVCWGGRTFVFKNEAQKLWLERCVEKGYTVPDWPKPYGGAGLSPEETKNQIGRASCRERVSQYVYITVVDVPLHKKLKIT